MIRIEAIWLALGASDLRGGIDRLLAMVVHGFALGAQPHHAYLFANRRAKQTTFSIPIAVCRDRVSVAPAARQGSSPV
jgi:IS66 Orf2 like protein